MILLENKKIQHFFDIKKEFISGVVLLGYEVKCFKFKKINIINAYIKIDNFNVILKNCIIDSLYFISCNFFKDRDIKLLLKKKEIIYLNFFLKQKGFTILVKNVLLIRNKIKLTICLVTSKKKYDKRNIIINNYINKEIKFLLKDKGVV